MRTAIRAVKVGTCSERWKLTQADLAQAKALQGPGLKATAPAALKPPGHRWTRPGWRVEASVGDKTLGAKAAHGYLVEMVDRIRLATEGNFGFR